MSYSEQKPGNGVPVHVYVLIVVVSLLAVAGGAFYNQQQTRLALSDSQTLQSIAASKAFNDLLNQKLQIALASSESNLVDSLTQNENFQTHLDSALNEGLASYGRSDQFQQAVVQALPEPSDIDDNKDRLKLIQSKMNQYESRLSQISKQVDNDDSAKVINELQGNFIELQLLIGGLSEEVRCSLSLAAITKSSFLLKERRSTDLRVYEVMVTLGRIRNGVIDSVTISGPNADSTQSDTRVVGNVKLGSKLDFQSAGRSFEGVFTFRQPRFGPDFVGFEVTELLSPNEGCIQEETEEEAVESSI